MSTHKHIDKICLVAVMLALLLMLVFVNGETLGLQPASQVMGYEQCLFDTSKVHTLDIVMDDWDSFIETCENEEYTACAVVIDGEAYKNVAIRAKGNTSLSSVASMDSDRYSFKIEFDQYDSSMSYHGLDKLSLNNLIQDNTMMKDYLTYQMMDAFGAAAPLCSYVHITVNGEDWGLYLAVEGIEDSFLQRNYGKDYGELYKPDSMDMGGGRGNGRDFNMEDFADTRSNTKMRDGTLPSTPGGDTNVQPTMPNTAVTEGFGQGRGMGGQFAQGVTMPEGFAPSAGSGGEAPVMPENFNTSNRFGGEGGNRGDGMMGGGMGSAETKLQYIDDDPASYETIFSSAKTELTAADKTRLIQALKALSAGGNMEDIVDVDAVIRYFVVHNFVVNGDSYTGNMIHNYYLYEEDGRLAMLPWDYNLAFGAFQSSNATSSVNDPIDTPLSVTGNGDRPMVDWIFSNEAYTELYHQLFAQFLEDTDFVAMIDETAALIAPYVKQDSSKFCTYAEFETGVAALREFCLLRAESVRGQLAGTIPSTSDGQRSASAALIDASHISTSDMGSMNMGGMGGGFANDAANTRPNGFDRDFAANGGNAIQSNSNRDFQPGSFPGVTSTQQAASRGGTWLLTGITVLILLAGLLIAFLYKRKS